MTTQAARIAALVGNDRRAADMMLGEFASDLIRAGRDVHGLIQWRGADDAALVDLRSGQRYPLFQKLGAGSQSCAVDPGNIALASQALRRALTGRADLVIANRFGALEAAGGGLLDEMLALMAAGIPFLTIVADEYLPHWRRTTGECAVELPAERAAVDDWFRRALA